MVEFEYQFGTLYSQAPMILMGAFALLGGVASMYLPETLGSLTIQSLRDVDNLETTTKPFLAYWTGKKLSKHLQLQTAKKESV